MPTEEHTKFWEWPILLQGPANGKIKEKERMNELIKFLKRALEGYNSAT